MILLSLFMLVASVSFGDDTTTPIDVDSLPKLEEIRDNDGFKNIAIKQFVSLDTFEGSIQGYQLTCDDEPNGKIGFCGLSCNALEEMSGIEAGLQVSRPCAEFLNDYLPKCLVKIGCYNNAAFCGSGGYAKRAANTPGGSNTPSRHSTGDALDLFGLNCKDKNGNNNNITFNKATFDGGGKQRQRYDDFVKCWREQVNIYNGKTNANCGGAISCEGSEEPNNGLHNDHVHISCPVKRKNVIAI